MKNIELTEEHKSKLLEMCKKLFSEYVEIDFDESGLLTLWKEKCPSTQWTEIHWFEFCLNELCFKILDVKRDYLGLSQLQKFRLQEYSKNHPVDYLYEEFKKLK